MNTPQPTVAIMGTRRMGGTMAATLSRVGFDVTVWNRSRVRAEAAAESIGALVAASAPEAAGDADIGSDGDQKGDC